MPSDSIHKSTLRAPLLTTGGSLKWILVTATMALKDDA